MAIPKHIKFTLTNQRFVGISDIQRNAIANEMINIIQARTSIGIDKNGAPFAAYKESYKKSAHFKDAGKSSKVNLVFSNEMMNSLDYLQELSDGPNITIGFDAGSDTNKIAQYVIEGHGRKGDFTQAGRDPMGLTPGETNTVVNMVPVSETNGSGSGFATGIFLGLSAGFLEGIF
jgi:hypothetical protein